MPELSSPESDRIEPRSKETATARANGFHQCRATCITKMPQDCHGPRVCSFEETRQPRMEYHQECGGRVTILPWNLISPEYSAPKPPTQIIENRGRSSSFTPPPGFLIPSRSRRYPSRWMAAISAAVVARLVL